MASKNKKSIKFLPRGTQRTVEFRHKYFHFPHGTSRLTFLLLILIISCHTTPIISETIFEEMNSIPLDKNAFAYVFINVNESRSIIDILPVEQLKNWQAKLILESTDMAAAALFRKESGRHFQAVGWGNYPSLRASIALFFNTTWNRQRSAAGSYWNSDLLKLSIVINPKQVFAIAWHNKHENPVPASDGVKMPEGFSRFMYGAALSCWMESPDILLNQILANEGIPLKLPAEQLFLSLYPRSGNQYEVLLRLKFENAVQTRAVAAILSLANSTFSADQQSLLASIFFANPPLYYGQFIDIKTALLSEKEITLLMQMFLLYWR